MNLFRSEEHVDAWLAQAGLERGAVFEVERCWALARVWHAERLSPQWRRRTPAEAQQLFEDLGLTGAFWRL